MAKGKKTIIKEIKKMIIEADNLADIQCGFEGYFEGYYNGKSAALEDVLVFISNQIKKIL